MASKCSSKLPPSRPQSLSPSSLTQRLGVLLDIHMITASKYHYPLDYCLQVCSIIASKCISKLTQLWCGETVQLLWHLKGIGTKEQFWHEKHRKMVREYEGVLSCEEPHKLCGSMKAGQKCVGQRAGKDRLCISYNEMISIYSLLLSPFLVSLYLCKAPTMSLSPSLFSLYLCTPPAGFPLPNWMALVSNRFSRNHDLQEHL